MAIRVRWDIQESVLLLHTYFEIEAKKVDRKQAISELSRALRLKAQRAGIEIDDVFRNKNGITMQLSKMAYVVTNGEKGLKCSSKIYYEAFEFYKNDKTQYDSILKEAIEMSTPHKTSEDKFFEWLAPKVSSKQLSEFYDVMYQLNEFLQLHSKRDTEISLTDITEASVVQELEKKLSIGKTSFGRKSISVALLQHYTAYLQETKPVAMVKREVVKQETQPLQGSTSKNQRKNNARVDFIDWLRQSGESLSTVTLYRSALKACSDYARKKRLTSSDFSTIQSPNRLRFLCDQLKRDKAFMQKNDQCKNRYLDALEKYIEFASIPQKRTNTVKQKPVEQEKPALPIVQPKPEPIPVVAVQSTGFDRYNTILKEHFPDGLRQNVIHINKFKKRYEDEYGKTIELDKDALLDALKKAGSLRDGRIYAKQDEAQSNLMNDIHQEIVKTFEAGATVVYMESVFGRYREELAEQMSVYNEDSLSSLFQAQFRERNNSVYVPMGRTLQSVTCTADPSKDVVNVMQNSHVPMSYAELQQKLWYLPLSEIKKALVSTPTLVNVERECYYYAPNLPISTEEQCTIQQAFAMEIERRGFLVAKDIKRILAECCSSVAINTESFTDWGLRNVFGYLFRSRFVLNGALLCEKGQTLNMWDAYSRFCREYEQLTLEELKQFSSEVGTPIYWGAVLQEMVRVSENELIRKDLICFDVAKTDKVLEIFCEGDYIPLHEISLFLQFPAIEVPWNRFVLESYLLNASRAFRLYQASISQSDCYGIVVRASSRYQDYESVVIDALAQSDEWTNEKSALEWIVRSGFQAKKAWSNFAQVVKVASLQREKRKEREK